MSNHSGALHLNTKHAPHATRPFPSRPSPSTRAEDRILSRGGEGKEGRGGGRGEAVGTAKYPVHPGRREKRTRGCGAVNFSCQSEGGPQIQYSSGQPSMYSRRGSEVWGPSYICPSSESTGRVTSLRTDGETCRWPWAAWGVVCSSGWGPIYRWIQCGVCIASALFLRALQVV